MPEPTPPAAGRDELRRLAAAATPPPWEVRPGRVVFAPCKCCGLVADCAQFGPDPECSNAAYIVAACNAVPGLLADLERAEAGMAAMREALESFAERYASYTVVRGVISAEVIPWKEKFSAALSATAGAALLAERDALRRRVAELEAGLRPFADIADGPYLPPNVPDDAYLIWLWAAGDGSHKATVGDCRRAAALRKGGTQ